MPGQGFGNEEAPTVEIRFVSIILLLIMTITNVEIAVSIDENTMLLRVLRFRFMVLLVNLRRTFQRYCAVDIGIVRVRIIPYLRK